MVPCPTCGNIMEYVAQYQQYYCGYCRNYMQAPPPAQYHPPAPFGSPTPFPQHAREDEKKGIIVIVSIFLIIVVILILAPIFYIWSLPFEGGSGGYHEEFVTFPTIEITLKDYSNDGDSLRVKHIQGDPLDWSGFKMILTNNPDATDTAVMTDLSSLSQITAGESSTITESGITGFSDIDYQKGKAYQLEIYNLRENKRVYNRDNIICE